MINIELEKNRISELELLTEGTLYHHSSECSEASSNSKINLYQFEKYVDEATYKSGIDELLKYLSDNGYESEESLVSTLAPIVLEKLPIYVSSVYSDYKSKELWSQDAERPQKTDEDLLNCCSVLELNEIDEDKENEVFVGKMISDRELWEDYIEGVFQAIDNYKIEDLVEQRANTAFFELNDEQQFRTYLLMEEIIKSFPFLNFDKKSSDEYRLVKCFDPSEILDIDNSKGYYELELNDDLQLSFQKLLCRKPANKKTKTNQDETKAKQQDLFS